MTQESNATKFAKGVKKFLQLDDESKAYKFYTVATKSWRRQIEICKADIEELKEKIAEVNEEKLTDTIYQLDMDRVKTTDDRKNYIGDYTNSVLRVKDEIEELEERVENIQEVIDNFNYLLDTV